MFFDVSFALQLDGFELHLTFLNLILHLVMNEKSLLIGLLGVHLTYNVGNGQ